VRAIGIFVLLAGCSSSKSGPADMTTAPDLSPVCTINTSGDVTASIACRNFLCHPPGYEDLDLAGPVDMPWHHAIFDVDGAFALRSYAAADLKTFDVGVRGDTGKSYSAQPTLAGSTVSLTLSHIVEPNDPCSGLANGSAQATLVEYDTSTGMPTGSGRVTATITF
jgi:hypothetical protein